MDSSSKRKIVAILFADIQGYTALMQRDEVHASILLKRFQKELAQKVKSQNGHIIHFYGDGALCTFNNPLEALWCAMAFQTGFQKEPAVPVRAGIHMGTVVIEEGTAYGDSINIASRIESLAIPGSILISKRVRDELKNQPDLQMTSLGKFEFKNVEEPMEVFALANPGFVVPKRENIKGKLQTRAATAKIKWLALVIAGLILLASVVSLIIYNRELSTKSAELSTGSLHQRLAVLPFYNLRDDPSSDFLGLALADEIIGDLSYVKELVVRPTSAVRKYAKIAVDAPTAGEELNVDYILVGSYLKEGVIIRMDLELVGVKANERVWWEEIEEEYENTFQLQEMVSEKVLNGLKIQFSEEESRRRTADISEDPLAYEYYLRALAQPSSNEGYQMAINLLNKSIVLDSVFAPSWAELGWRIKQLGAYTIGKGYQIDEAEQMLKKALELNKDLQNALGYMVAIYVETGRIDQSIEMARHLLFINPNSAIINFMLGYTYRYAGFLEQAEQQEEKAMSLDPNNLRYRATGQTQIYLGNLGEALKRLERFNDNPYNLAWQGQVHLRLGNFERALELFNKVIEMDQQGVGKWASSMKYHLEGKPELGRNVLQELEVNSMDAEQIYNIANLYGLLNFKKDCIRNLRKAVSRGFFSYPVLQNDQFLDSVRNEPDFLEVLEEARIKHEAFGRRYF